jgi:hypothetical protein
MRKVEPLASRVTSGSTTSRIDTRTKEIAVCGEIVEIFSFPA